MDARLPLISPGSSGASSMEQSPQAVDMPGPFPRPQDLAGLTTIDMSFKYPPSENRMRSWYRSNDGPWIPPGLASIPDDGRTSAVAGGMPPQPMGFHGQYRESIVPSECDTTPGVLPSDSGYGSYVAKHSVANDSVCDDFDRNQDAQSLAGNISELPFHPFHGQDMMQKIGVNTGIWISTPVSGPDRQYHMVEPQLMCTTCGKTVKTNSELKKHQQRHTKPHKCDVPGCTRTEGFSTVNDLDRHKRSVHPDIDAAGNLFMCPHGTCGNKDKKWPRADNFKAHLRRVHRRETIQDEDLEQYVYKPSPAPPNAAGTIGGNSAGDMIQPGYLPSKDAISPNGWNPIFDLTQENQFRDQTRITLLEDPHVQQQPADQMSKSGGPGALQSTRVTQLQPPDSQESGSELKQIQYVPGGDLIGDIEHGTLDQAAPDRYRRNTESETPSTVNIAIMDGRDDQSSDAQDISSGQSSHTSEVGEQSDDEIVDLEPLSGVSPCPRGPVAAKGASIEVDLSDPSEIRRLFETLSSKGLLEKYGEKYGLKKEEPVNFEDSKADSTIGASRDSTYPCPAPGCTKTFVRRCELKKHQKRHLKPYGCTYPDCNKKFGSKNDWKRHENSQHFVLESWKCAERDYHAPGTGICGEVLYRRKEFCEHLATRHLIKDPSALDMKIESCRIGRNCEARFWCGFCNAIIENSDKGLAAWTARFNHIDDHYTGRNGQVKQEVSEWKYADPNQKRPPSPEPGDDSSDAGSPSSRRPPPPEAPAIVPPPASDAYKRQRERPAKPKRKRGGDDEGSSSKRSRKLADPQLRFSCCQCQDTMPETNRECTNFPCQHRMCPDCRVTR
ncbi:hypothetical protein F4778DRAFT_158908 [Xylariomycetidae sp. FL2044]|nr:hypothetical protein F4778DRAFT_158908 [Xylariomycetidae sp. FL2044]